MLRLILIFLLVVFVAMGLLAVALEHFFGVKGLIVFPFVIIGLFWVTKWFIKSLVKKFALSLFGMKARALRGATMTVHSIKTIPEPPKSKPEPDEDDEEDADPPSPDFGATSPPSLGSGAASDSPSDSSAELRKTGEVEKSEDKDEEDNKAAAVSPEKEEPKDYVELDVTITPKKESCNMVWEPTEFILASEKIRSLADLEDRSVGDVHSVEIWDGTAFGPDDSDKYPGEQRLKIVFEVKPGTKSGWLCYYNEPIGELALPVGTVEV